MKKNRKSKKWYVYLNGERKVFGYEFGDKSVRKILNKAVSLQDKEWFETLDDDMANHDHDVKHKLFAKKDDHCH